MSLETRDHHNVAENFGKPRSAPMQGERSFKLPVLESERQVVDPRTQVVNALAETINLISVPGLGKAAVESTLKDPAFKTRKTGELKSYRVNKFGNGKFRANEGIALNDVMAAAQAHMASLTEADQRKLSQNLQILNANSKRYLDRGKRRNTQQYNARISQEADSRGISFEAAKKLIDERIELVMPTSRRKSVAKSTTEKRIAGKRPDGDDLKGDSRGGSTGTHKGADRGFEGRPSRSNAPARPASADICRKPSGSESDVEQVITAQSREAVQAPGPRRKFRDIIRNFKAKRIEARSNRKIRRRQKIAGSLAVITLGTPVAVSAAANFTSERGGAPTTVASIVSAGQNRLENIFDTPVRVGGVDYNVQSRQALQSTVETRERKSDERPRETVVWESRNNPTQTTTGVGEILSANPGRAGTSVLDTEQVVVENNTPNTTVSGTIPRRERGAPTVRNNSADRNAPTTTAAEPTVKISEPPVVATTIPEAPPVVEHVTAAEPAPEPEPSTEAGRLAKRILSHPNISISESVNDRVRQSVEDVIDDGKTFLVDIDRNNQDEMDIDPQLLKVILDLANNNLEVVMTSLTTSDEHSSGSAHYVGKGIDIGFKSPEDYRRAFAHLYFNSETYNLDELIWGGALPVGTSTLKRGNSAQYLPAVLNGHRTHLHFSTN